MKKELFQLSGQQLQEIAVALKEKIGQGLEKEGQEILAIPTYITPRNDIRNEKALVLDLGGTNCRVAIVDFKENGVEIHPINGWKRDLSVTMKKPGATQEELYHEIADMVSTLDLEGVTSIGYCFSYPGESTLDGDAELIRWTKGVNIPEMIGQRMGKSLMDYLNNHLQGKAKFTNIKVINDTVASLFAGLTDTEADAYIGLIVGTGTNMAAFFNTKNIGKLDPAYKKGGLLPVNLESGNFHPPHLSIIDDKMDKHSATRGAQRFEKAISGYYLGRILEYVFSCDEFEEDFDAAKLSRIMSYPDMYKEEYVAWAHMIYGRSAKLVAASLAGLIVEMLSFDPSIKNIRLVAEGSLFWSGDRRPRAYRKYKCYHKIVLEELDQLLNSFGYSEVKVRVEQQENANLVGSAIAGLS